MHYKTCSLILNKADNHIVGFWKFPNDTDKFVKVDEIVFRDWIISFADWLARFRYLSLSSHKNKVLKINSQESAEVDGRTEDGIDSKVDIKRGNNSWSAIETIGISIFNHFFTSEVRTLWNAAFPANLQESIRLVLKIDIDSADEFISIPFESIYSKTPGIISKPIVTDYFVLSKDFSITRSYDIKTISEREKPEIDLPLSVLVFASNPNNLPDEDKLNIDEEIKGIENAVQEIGSDIKLKILESPTEATFNNLSRIIKHYQVFHFENNAAQILFDDGNGNPDWRRISDVVRLLADSNVSLVVLNGCRTAAISKFASLFPAVVGMQFPISDKAAINFAKGMYKELAHSGQIDCAVYAGRREIWSERKDNEKDEFYTPVLFLNEGDGVLVKIKPKILNTNLEKGEKGKDYSALIKAKGGRTPFSWDVEGFPPGLSYKPISDAEEGEALKIFGKPQGIGVFPIIVKVKSYDGLTGEARFALEIEGTIGLEIPGYAGDYLDHPVIDPIKIYPNVIKAASLPHTLKSRTWGAIHGYVPNSLKTCNIIISTLESQNQTLIDSHVAQMLIKEFDFGLIRSNESSTDFDEPPKLVTGSRFCLVRGGCLGIGYHESDIRNAELKKIMDSTGFGSDINIIRNNYPPGRVHVNTYLMQKYEVTNREYEQFLKATQYLPPAHWSEMHAPQNMGDHPVVKVSYEDAIAYCEWKTQLAHDEGLQIYYDLPSEWEYEKAAKGNIECDDTNEADRISTPLFPWGDDFRDQSLNHLGANIGETSIVNRYGAKSNTEIRDWGNVSELINGGKAAEGRVFKSIRGASFRKHAMIYALTFGFRRTYVEKNDSFDDVGFRCVIRPNLSSYPIQAMVPLGDDMFVDGSGNEHFIDGFFMARFAVSNEEYASIMGSINYKQSEKWHPVTNISLEDAKEFCKRKSEREGRMYRLPARVEWERACRGLNQNKYPWGNKYSRYFCNSLESGWGRLINVWELPEGVSSDGIYNLCGNTFEWLEDGQALGGSWLSTCQGFGAPPYDGSFYANDHGPHDDIGFRYVTNAVH